MDKYFIVRGMSGFVRVWSHAVIHIYRDNPDYEILGHDLRLEEAVALSKIANVEVIEKMKANHG